MVSVVSPLMRMPPDVVIRSLSLRVPIAEPLAPFVPYVENTMEESFAPVPVLMALVSTRLLVGLPLTVVPTIAPAGLICCVTQPDANGFPSLNAPAACLPRIKSLLLNASPPPTVLDDHAI